ncbi:RNA polymerase sigma factor [Tengunoibacter tsumagoiensis]|uniref:RNA polymerase sigma factor n=1 Tax=Tengunoibacter tsumagoiensis TaxID=2014871 RepID=A0A401ZWG5_9CHLR|nr:RNA polymerase sigma factor [Tengunoibacter tsumagoiensis]GCE11251.1 RNA polymerase sigma factor [Tengunoibacter tsumagoiensis]
MVTCSAQETIAISHPEGEMPINELSQEQPELEDNQDRPEQIEQELLVMRALQGDQKAFSEIVDLYSTLMLRTASMIVGDRDIAEDVVQDALIQAWHHLGDLRKAGALRPWLMRIVVNQCISFKRRLARTTAFMRQALSEQETDLIAQAADDHKGRMERDWDLARAIESLPIKQRVVIVLHYYNSMTLPEMAQALNTSENTLKKRIQAALTNLRRMLRTSSEEEGMMNTSFATLLPSVAY